MKRFSRSSFRWTLAALVLVLSLVLPWIVLADTFVWDGDIVTVGNQTTVNLGTVSPGATIIRAISFQLQCAGKQHVDDGQTVGIAFNLAGSTVPLGGSLSATNASIGAIPPSWPDDTAGGGSTNCPSPTPLLDDNGNSSATITAPTTPGSYTFVVVYSSSLSPAGNGDPQAITGPNPSVTFNMVVQAPSDTTPPTINCGAADTNWHATDQSVTCTASDPSGLANPGDASFTLSTSVAAGAETDNAYTGTKSVCDTLNNCATAGPVGPFKIDKKAPVVTCSSADGNWHATDQSVTCTATDGGSGPASQEVTLSTSVPAGTETDSASTNSATVQDNVGNSATAGPVGPFKIDKKAPSITWNGSINDGDSFYYGDVPAEPTCTATDSGSGPKSCKVSGYNAEVGTHTLTATAYDNVDNKAEETRSYTVLAWTLYGFYQPVDMGDIIWNTVKGGSTVPLKFEVFKGLTELTDPSVVKSFVATSVACPKTGCVADEIEFVTTGGTILRYDWTAGQFIQNWQTPKKPGACYQVTMTTQDGSKLVANFALK